MQKIDQLLVYVGWVIQDQKDLNLGSSLGVAVREFTSELNSVTYQPDYPKLNQITKCCSCNISSMPTRPLLLRDAAGSSDPWTEKTHGFMPESIPVVLGVRGEKGRA